MIDLHCHIDLYPKPADIIAQIARNKMYVLAVTTTPLAFEGNLKLVANTPRIKVAIGLHPAIVAERSSEVKIVCSYIPTVKYVGEIGLDGSPENKSTLSQQQVVFNHILSCCAEHGGRIMSIHSRGATSLVLDAIEKYPNAGKPILHWFSGTPKELNRAIDLGCWFSIGPAMIKSQKGNLLIKSMPNNRVLTETDGPFTTNGNLPLMPWDVENIFKELAHVWHMSSMNTEQAIQNNFKVLLT